MLKRTLHITFLLTAIAILGASASSAQKKPGNGNSASQSAQREIHLSGSPMIGLTLNPSLVESVTTDQDDTTLLTWGEGNGRSKITVSTFSPGQQYDLVVEATEVDNARASGPITLIDGMQDRDLIVNVHKNKIGSARLVYTASTTIENGNSDTGSSDVHTVTYTVTDM